jgi:hypothetical protein
MTLRDLYNLTAAARGHWVLWGLAERIIDTLQQWFDEYAADGFNVKPPYFHEGFEAFIQFVVTSGAQSVPHRLSRNDTARSFGPSTTDECFVPDMKCTFEAAACVALDVASHSIRFVADEPVS